MPVISPTTTLNIDGITAVSWVGITTGDTIQEYIPRGLTGAVSSVQVTGTFGGATVTMTGSNDKINYVTLPDLSNAAISLTTAGLLDFTTAALYVRPLISGGSANSIDVTLVMRG